MRVLVLLAGVVDPKWPLALASDGVPGPAAGAPRRLSPFDESALEVALKLRDRAPDTRIEVVLAGGAQVEVLARAAAAFRPDCVTRLDLDPGRTWDMRYLVGRLGAACGGAGERHEVVLIGREFGDCDDGVVPAALAEAGGWRHVGLAQRIDSVAEGLEVHRVRGALDEFLCVPPPLLASVTNDRGNRLRHPLMKNVVAAKHVVIHVLPEAPTAESAVRLESLEAAPPVVRGEGRCRMLQGAGDAQIGELAAYLRAGRLPA